MLNVLYAMGMLSAEPRETANARYDLHIESREGTVPGRVGTAQEVAARLDAGQSLTTGQVAILLGVTRYGVDYWLVEGIRVPGEAARWRPEFTASPGGHRRITPAAVRRLAELATQDRPRRARRHDPEPEVA